jgi:hypothetical protein
MVELLLCLVVWTFLHVDARLAFPAGRSRKRLAVRTALEIGAALIFSFQVSLMELLAPQDAYGSHFLMFTLGECGGGILVLFLTLMQTRKVSPAIERKPA